MKTSRQMNERSICLEVLCAIGFQYEENTILGWPFLLHFIRQYIDPLDIIADRYLAIPCSVMSPNVGRLQLLDELIDRFAIDGVIDFAWRTCHTYAVESTIIKRHIEDRHGKKCMALEADFGEHDTEQLRIRIQAFVEML